MAEKKAEEVGETPAAPVTKGGRSLFAPLAMIAIGVLFLLDNLNVIGPLNWAAALRFWPLALIFLGLNVLAVQFRRPLGTVLSLLVTAAALAVFGFLLLRGSPDDTLRGLGLPVGSAELRQETFALPADGVASAEIELHLANLPATIGPLTDGGLIAGTIWTAGELALDQASDAGGHVALEVGSQSDPSTWLDPRTWGNEPGRRWTIDLSPDVPLDLAINGSNGQTTAALDELTLTALTLNSSNGSVQATLPDGDYNINVDSGNGSVTLTLPGAGQQAMRLDSGNGRAVLALPEGVEARVEYDLGNGRLSVDERFTQVSGDRDEGVYETAGYDAAAEGIAVRIDSGNGSVTISAP